MRGTKNRNIKILGAAWLVTGAVFLALAIIAFLSVVLGDDPAGQAFESGDKWWIVVLVLLVLGAIPTVNGLALLRRARLGRRLLAISSLALLIPSAVGTTTGIGIPFLVVVVASLWLTLTQGGKEAYESYMARANG